MRIPLQRSWGNETPIAWWELLFTPVVLAYLCLTLLLRIPYLVVYPERQAFDLDFGSEPQRKLIDQYGVASRGCPFGVGSVGPSRFTGSAAGVLPRLTGPRRRPVRSVIFKL